MMRIWLWVQQLTVSSSNADPSNPDSHKNEGFLKSMWHTLTNHPAHQHGEGEGSGSNKDDSNKSDGDKKSNNSNSS